MTGSRPTYHSAGVHVAGLRVSRSAPCSQKELCQLVRCEKALSLKEAQKKSQGRDEWKHWQWSQTLFLWPEGTQQIHARPACPEGQHMPISPLEHPGRTHRGLVALPGVKVPRKNLDARTTRAALGAPAGARWIAAAGELNGPDPIPFSGTCDDPHKSAWAGRGQPSGHCWSLLRGEPAGDWQNCEHHADVERCTLRHDSTWPDGTKARKHAQRGASLT